MEEGDYIQEKRIIANNGGSFNPDKLHFLVLESKANGVLCARIKKDAKCKGYLSLPKVSFIKYKKIH